jgi:hypothetical protein
MKLRLLTISLITLLLLTASHSQAIAGCWGGRYPHGNYCEGPGWGWYGERKTVRTQAEAIKILKQYFSSVEGVRINTIKEREWFFEAEIRDKKNNVTDVVIIDKRTGRIRSIY